MKKVVFWLSEYTISLTKRNVFTSPNHFIHFNRNRTAKSTGHIGECVELKMTKELIKDQIKTDKLSTLFLYLKNVCVAKIGVKGCCSLKEVENHCYGDSVFVIMI